MISPAYLLGLSLGTILFLVGWVMTKWPPKKINHWYGYRTPKSMKSEENWHFAQKKSAKLSKIFGVLIIVLTPLFDYLEINFWIFFGIYMVIFMTPIILIEIALSRKEN